jgi:hypothetical protein
MHRCTEQPEHPQRPKWRSDEADPDTQDDGPPAACAARPAHSVRSAASVLSWRRFSCARRPTPAAGDLDEYAVGSVIAYVEETRGRGFEDETEVPETGVLVRVRHVLQPLADRHTRISYTCVVDGPNEIGAEIGAAVSADFADVIAALAARAESTR